MIAISDLIRERETSNRALRQVRLADRMDSVYRQHPDLLAIDNSIVAARSERLVARLEDQQGSISFYESELKRLSDKRKDYIIANKVDPMFDQEQSICGKCSDTGFITTKSGIRKVCSCMDEVLKECFAECGMGDYATFDTDSLKLDMFDDAKERAARRDQLLKFMTGMAPMDRNPLMIYAGRPRTGKTFLSVCMVKTAIRMGMSAAYIKAEKFAEQQPEDLGFMKYCDFLCIDDYIGEVTLNAVNATRINDILEVRLATGKPTLIVTPLTAREIADRSDLRIGSKLYKAGEIR